MKKLDLIELILSYYKDYLSVLTIKELKRVLAQAENNQISI
jgi:hypothetical protein